MMHIVIPGQVEDSPDVDPNEFALVQSKIPNPQFENHMSIYRSVLRYYRPFVRQTIFALCLSLLAIGISLLMPWPFMLTVDDYFRAGSTLRSTSGAWVLL